MTGYRYGPYTGGPDPLAPPYDARRALDELGESVLGGADPGHVRIDHAVGAARAGSDLVNAFRWVFIAAAALLAAGLVAMLIVEERELRGKK